MTGIRTASLLTVVAGLCFVAGRGGVFPSEVLASLKPDWIVMRRLQIVLGRPAPPQQSAPEQVAALAPVPDLPRPDVVEKSPPAPAVPAPVVEREAEPARIAQVAPAEPPAEPQES